MNAGHDHRQAWELIPWYVNDTLEPLERGRVEAHLAGCAECRAEVALCRDLVAAGGRPEDLAPAPHPAQLDRLVERIAAAGEEPAEPVRLTDRLRRLPPALRLAAAALALLAAGLVGYLAAPGPARSTASDSAPRATGAASYRTLSQPEATPADRADSPLLRIVFAPSTPEEEIRRIVLAVGGEISGGPSPLGVYTVRARPDGEGAEPLPVVLQHLRRQPEVLFVEPVGSDAEAGGRPPGGR